jgi:hypothetical protein
MMKKQSLITSVFFILVCMSFQSCKKDEATAPVTPAATSTFTWKENAGALITADSAYWTAWNTGTGIRAYKGGYQNYFEINWASANNTSPGAKALITNNGDFTFLKGTDSYDISSNQNLNITAFTNNKLSGNFTLAVKGGTITSIEATFTELPKK